ncbi:MAG TPA: family 16 glycoside hydrolase [Ktedonobacterales bacterium]|nr:family 16 glycoside hydrolase [Ktedonobacterales bacterium]
MKCANCGAALSPGSAFCMVCGAATAAPTSPASASSDAPRGAGEFTQTDQSAANAQLLRPQTAFYGRYGTRGNIVLPAPSSLSLPTTILLQSDTPASNSPPASTPAAEEPPLPSITDAPTAPLAPAKPARPISVTIASRSRRPLAGRLSALAGLLLLLILLVSLSMLGYNAYKKGLTTARATATADARQSATSTAAAQASATASVPLFTDSLASNTNGWTQNGATAFFANGQYHLHDPNPATTLDAYYQQQVFDNFKVQVTVTTYTDANPDSDVPYAYGLILRADPNTPANKYVFFVSPAGTYDFARHDDGGFINNGWNDLSATPWTSSSAIHTGKGATNTLMVIASDNTFTLFINGQQIEVVTDTFSGYSSGWIGLLVEGADMEAGFSNLQVSSPGA